ncbi:MAG: alpha-mannosidase, partial [Treponema sp.]|nr:alpha-mannosidase [Treponema sp.]
MLVPKIEQRIEQYLALLEREAYREVAPLAFEIFETERTYREPPEGVDWRPVAAGGAWGAAWHCAWFRAVFRAGPVGRHGRPLFLRVLPNADSLAFIDGRPAGAFNLFHKKLRLGPEEADGREHRLHVEAYAGHPYGGCGPFEGPSVVVTIGKTLPAFPNTFDGGALLERLEGIYQLYYDVLCLFGAARTLGEDSAPASLRRARILSGLYEALSAEVSLCARGEALEAQALAARARVAPLLAARNGSTAPVFYLTGHAHIDHAWLWPIAETERKIAR